MDLTVGDMQEALVRAASLTGYVELARALGLDPLRMAAAQGLPRGCFANPDLKIPAGAVGRLFEQSAERSGAFDFGLRLAETRNLSNLGVVGLVLREQPTLRKALDTLVAYARIQNEALHLQLDRSVDDVVVLRPVMMGPSVQAGRQNIELILGVLVRIIRRLIGQDWRPDAVYLTHSRPQNVVAYRRVLGVTPIFDQDFNGLVIVARDLDSPIPDSDPVAAARVQRYAEMESGASRNDPVPIVRELILALLPTGDCTIERVARHMGVSRRTLHRRLAAENGLTFSDLVNEVRLACAESYIADGRHSLTEIAERLGYGSLSAFSRWRRHTAKSHVRNS